MGELKMGRTATFVITVTILTIKKNRNAQLGNYFIAVIIVMTDKTE